MAKETYEIHVQVCQEKGRNHLNFENTAVANSNLENYLEIVTSFSSKLATTSSSSAPIEKEKLQKLIFPDGIFYCSKTEAFRTRKVNLVFQLNADLNSVSEDDIKNKVAKSHLVLFSREDWTGFEPFHTGFASNNRLYGAIRNTPDNCATELHLMNC